MLVKIKSFPVKMNITSREETKDKVITKKGLLRKRLFQDLVNSF